MAKIEEIRKQLEPKFHCKTCGKECGYLEYLYSDKNGCTNCQEKTSWPKKTVKWEMPNA